MNMNDSLLENRSKKSQHNYILLTAIFILLLCTKSDDKNNNGEIVDYDLDHGINFGWAGFSDAHLIYVRWYVLEFPPAKIAHRSSHHKK